MKKFNLLNYKEHRLIPYIIISLNNLFSYAGESYEKWSLNGKKGEMKKILQNIGKHGKTHFQVNSQILFANESEKHILKKGLILVAEVLIDIRNWLFHPEQKQEVKIKVICKKLDVNNLLFFEVIWKILACFLYKNEVVQLLNELDQIYGLGKFEERQKYLKRNFYSISDSFSLSINSLDIYSCYCQKTINCLEDNFFSLELKENWNNFLNTNYQYSNLKFNYNYLSKELVLTFKSLDYLTIQNLECVNLKKLKMSKLFYSTIVNLKKIKFDELQSIDSGFITKKYKRLIKEIYKVLKIQEKFETYKIDLINRLNKRSLLTDNSLEFIQKIDLFKIRNQAFHFSYKKESEQEIYSQFFYLIAHLESKNPKIWKIEEDLCAKLNCYLENSLINNIFLI